MENSLSKKTSPLGDFHVRVFYAFHAFTYGMSRYNGNKHADAIRCKYRQSRTRNAKRAKSMYPTLKKVGADIPPIALLDGPRISVAANEEGKQII